MPLTDTQLRQLKPKDRPYKVADGGGLLIHVTPNGSRLWRLRYRFDGVEKLMAFGAYPEVSLARAREKQRRQGAPGGRYRPDGQGERREGGTGRPE